MKVTSLFCSGLGVLALVGCGTKSQESQVQSLLDSENRIVLGAVPEFGSKNGEFTLRACTAKLGGAGIVESSPDRCINPFKTHEGKPATFAAIPTEALTQLHSAGVLKRIGGVAVAGGALTLVTAASLASYGVLPGVATAIGLGAGGLVATGGLMSSVKFATPRGIDDLKGVQAARAAKAVRIEALTPQFADKIATAEKTLAEKAVALETSKKSHEAAKAFLADVKDGKVTVAVYEAQTKLDAAQKVVADGEKAIKVAGDELAALKNTAEQARTLIATAKDANNRIASINAELDGLKGAEAALAPADEAVKAATDARKNIGTVAKDGQVSTEAVGLADGKLNAAKTAFEKAQTDMQRLSDLRKELAAIEAPKAEAIAQLESSLTTASAQIVEKENALADLTTKQAQNSSAVQAALTDLDTARTTTATAEKAAKVDAAKLSDLKKTAKTNAEQAQKALKTAEAEHKSAEAAVKASKEAQVAHTARLENLKAAAQKSEDALNTSLKWEGLNATVAEKEATLVATKQDLAAAIKAAKDANKKITKEELAKVTSPFVTKETGKIAVAEKALKDARSALEQGEKQIATALKDADKAAEAAGLIGSGNKVTKWVAKGVHGLAVLGAFFSVAELDNWLIKAGATDLEAGNSALFAQDGFKDPQLMGRGASAIELIKKIAESQNLDVVSL